jgi:peptide/nickel transport system permease protein
VLPYIARRLVLSLLTLWLVSVAAFVLLRVAPGDAAAASLAFAPGEAAQSKEQLERRRQELGLDRSWAVQYVVWAGALMRLDAGRSAASGQQVIGEVRPRLGVTLELAVATVLLVSAAGIGPGLLAAHARGKWADFFVRGLALIGLSTPPFWMGLLVIITLSAWADVFVAAAYVPFWDGPAANLRAVLPAAAVLAVRPAALLARVVRAAIVETLAQDFVRAARARGLSEAAVLWRHAFRAAALPVVTVIGVESLFLLGGAVVVEQVFGLPGVGRALVAGVIERDYPLIQFLLILFGLAAVALNLAVDMAYAGLDPRARAV